MAESINATEFIETSAKYGDYVNKAFENLVIEILRRQNVEGI